MRHRLKGRKLGRNTHQRQALFKDLIKNLIQHEQIKTTEAKAKTIKGLVDKLFTQAKQGSLSARRQTLAFITDKAIVHKLYDVLAPRTKNRNSGFTRLVRLGQRRGDNTMMATLELTDKSGSELPAARNEVKGSSEPKKVVKKVSKKK
jgi:large subunit ribosomal protein L17